jgi:hypothetical protein
MEYFMMAPDVADPEELARAVFDRVDNAAI